MEKFYLGLDIGSNSVGTACTDENYNLLRVKGKDCWSVRLFEESATAEKRRGFRTGRRRNERRKQRIGWLQALFAPFIEDKTFFIRLNNSQFFPEDKDEILGGDKNNLFGGIYDDKAFHAEFPTVYHLRERLITEGRADLRLYYLALHHIIKYRGHFLFDGGLDEVRDLGRLLEELNSVVSDLYDDAPQFDKTKADECKALLLNVSVGAKDKLNSLEKLFGTEDKVGKEILKSFAGFKISPSVLFGEEYKNEKSFSFKDMNDEAFEALRNEYADNFALLEKMRAIYGFVTFEKILAGHAGISSAMIAVYEKHKADLKRLKKFIRSERPDDYSAIFRKTDQKANYVNYIGYTSKGGVKTTVAKCKDEEFYAYLKKYLNGLTSVKDENTLKIILEEVENQTFLPKILHSDNGLFPRQVNQAELVKIVEGMVKFHPETKPVADRILPLFLFRVPYFVGPLTGKNSWVVRKNEKITPWNFDEVVDLAASNEEFMRRMTNKCSYLRGEDVLPKNSVIYQKFDVLNQLNKLKVNDCPVSVEIKKKIFDELFLVFPKVSDKRIKDLLVREGILSFAEAKDATLTGKDGEFKASMSAYVRLKKILGEFVDKDYAENGGVCENIILWHTLNTDKKIVENLILKNYGNIPVIKENIKQLKGLTFNEFGRLSQKLLTGIRAVDKRTGELVTVIEVLYETNENLNEILFDENYDFGNRIAEENGETSSKVTYADVEDLYVSPSVRRGIWQSLVIADEYVNAIGKIPDKIFIEVTREDGKKGDEGRTVSRKKQLLEKYKTVGEAYADVIAELGDEKYDDFKLRQERLYLYFRQLGKCMYTGERIVLSKLNSDLYDVDHILPRTFIKDDSLDNKVLVSRSANAKKSDTYPLPKEFFKQSEFWKFLLDKRLISRTTYERLTRKDTLSEEDFNYFINRQKTVTDQTVKAVAELMKRKFPDAKIVYSKAKNVSDFKHKFDIFKCRETNDLHHARDAYLNVVVGNVYDAVFSNPLQTYRKDGDLWRDYNLKKMFTRDVKGAWNGETIATVKKVTFKSSMTVTRYALCNKGEFYNQTVYGKGNKGITAPRKGKGPLSDFKKYGGYMSENTAYFAIVYSVGKKGEKIKTIEAVPVLTAYRARLNPGAVEEYLKTYLTDPQILVPKIKIKQLVKYNGVECYLAGVTGNRIIVHNGVQLFTDNKTDEYVNALLKIVEMKAKNMVVSEEDSYAVKTNRSGNDKLVVNRVKNVALYRDLKGRLSKSVYRGISAFETFKNNLEKVEDKFVSLTVIEQAQVLLQILKFFKCNDKTADLTLLGEGKGCGTLRINKNITNVEVKLINYSPAGLTKKVRTV